jgi:hypothetical protein
MPELHFLPDILYSYANIHPETGTIYLNDPNADEIVSDIFKFSGGWLNK